MTLCRFTRRLSISQLGLSVGAGGMDNIIAADMRAAHAAALDKVAFDAVRAGATFQSKTLTGASSDEYPATTLADLFALVQSYQTAAQSNGVPSLVCSPEAFEDLNSIENSNITSTLAHSASSTHHSKDSQPRGARAHHATAGAGWRFHRRGHQDR